MSKSEGTPESAEQQLLLAPIAGSGDDVSVEAALEPGSPAYYEYRIQLITRWRAGLLIGAAGLLGEQAQKCYQTVESEVRGEMRQFQLNEAAALANTKAG